MRGNSRGTQPYIHMYPFSPKLLSHPGWHITVTKIIFFLSEMKFGADTGIEYSGSNKTHTNTHTRRICVCISRHTYQFSSVAQLCLTLATPWTAAHQASLPITNSRSIYPNSCPLVGDAIQLSHPLSSCSPPAFNQLTQWVSSFYQVAKVLEFQSNIVLPMKTQDWSPFGWTGWISL